MQEVVKQSVKTSQIPLNWKKEESVYTGYHLIDAYLKGKQDGKDEMIKILTKQFKDNIDIATSISEKLYSCLLYTSDAADERSSVDLGGRRIIKKKKKIRKR